LTKKIPESSTVPDKKKERKNDHEHVRTGTSPAALKAAFQDNLNYVLGRPLDISTAEDRYQAIAQSVRDRIMQRWIKQVDQWNVPDVRQVSFLSAEFLVGPRLGKDLLNLGITENARRAMAELDLDLEEFVRLEKEPGLGKGGMEMCGKYHAPISLR
jgi:glycogen phosphorylase